MSYLVEIPKHAQKDLDKIPEPYQGKLLRALLRLERDPFIGKKLSGEHAGLLSYRVWPYRIIYEVRIKKLIVIIIRIGHRQGVYD